MGMNLADTPPLEGLDWATIRLVLGAVAGRNGPYRLTQRKTDSMDDYTLVGAIEACLMHGLIEDVRATETALTIEDLRYINRFRCTDKGDLIRAAALRPRMKRKEAERRIQQFLQNCVKANEDPELPTYVRSVWLAGSMLKGAGEVGDIDIAVSWDQKPFYRDLIAKDHGAKYVRTLALKRGLPDHLFGGVMAYNNLRSALQQRVLYGARKPAIFSEIELSTIVAMHDTCRCLFDAARGGIVDDPILPHHPESKGRGEEMLDPFALPTFETGLPIRPADAAWLTRYKTLSWHGPADMVHDRRPPDEYGTPWIYDDAAMLPRKGLKRQFTEAELAEMNGRDGVVLAVAYGTAYRIEEIAPDEAVHVRRSIEGPTVSITVRELSTRRGTVGKDSTMSPWFALMIASLGIVDAARLVQAGRTDGARISLAFGDDRRAKRNHQLTINSIAELARSRPPERRFPVHL